MNWKKAFHFSLIHAKGKVILKVFATSFSILSCVKANKLNYCQTTLHSYLVQFVLFIWTANFHATKAAQLWLLSSVRLQPESCLFTKIIL